jgi:hypothetical protein
MKNKEVVYAFTKSTKTTHAFTGPENVVIYLPKSWFTGAAPSTLKAVFNG